MSGHPSGGGPVVVPSGVVSGPAAPAVPGAGPAIGARVAIKAGRPAVSRQQPRGGFPLPASSAPWVRPAAGSSGDGTTGRAWLITFTDLICLLLTFFVMLYAMSEPIDHRHLALASALAGDAAPRGQGETPPVAPFTVDTLDRGRAIELGYLGKVFEDRIARYPELSRVLVTRRDDQLVLSLPADLLFAPGEAVLGPEGERALFVLGGVAANIGNALDVVGHADTTPADVRWVSNWELSLARAQAVAAALRGAGYLRPMTVRGQGDAHFPRVAPWRPREERMALARRVDLVVREHGGGTGGGLP